VILSVVFCMQLARLPVAYRSQRFTYALKAQTSLLHWPSLSSKTVVPTPNDTPFFGRDQELRNLAELCSGVPTSISLILVSSWEILYAVGAPSENITPIIANLLLALDWYATRDVKERPHNTAEQP